MCYDTMAGLVDKFRTVKIRRRNRLNPIKRLRQLFRSFGQSFDLTDHEESYNHSHETV